MALCAGAALLPGRGRRGRCCLCWEDAEPRRPWAFPVRRRPRSRVLSSWVSHLLGFWVSWRTGWNGCRRKSWKPRADVSVSSVSSCGFGRSPLDLLSFCEESLQIVCISRWEKDRSLIKHKQKTKFAKARLSYISVSFEIKPFLLVPLVTLPLPFP